MKKVGIFLLAIFCLTLIQAETIRAGERSFEEEILEILKEKQIITQEKYQELSRKLKAGSKSVNEEILDLLKEKEMVTEVRYQALKEKAVEEKKKEAEKVVEIPEGLKGVKFKGLWYIDYRVGEKSGRSYNEWSLTRGYIDLRKEITPWLSGRVTPDITRDDTGDYKLRLKYLYANFNLPNVKSALAKNGIEVGLIHVPWLDFEESVNPYRCQGTMFLERNGMFNSADEGVMFYGYLGGEMPEDYKKNVTDKYTGRYGSYALGVYNGSGYHAAEKNENKVFEGRITMRPLPDFIPGFQVSYFNITGKGNLEEGENYFFSPGDAQAGIQRLLNDPPDWRAHLAFLSYENSWGTFVGQYAWANGSQKGKYKVGVTDIVDERDKEGFSLFGFVKVPWDKRFRVFGRYDYWDPDTDFSNDVERRSMGGLSFDIYKGNMLVLDYENLDLPGGRPNEHFFQTVLQIQY